MCTKLVHDITLRMRSGLLVHTHDSNPLNLHYAYFTGTGDNISIVQTYVFPLIDIYFSSEMK